MGFDFLDFMKPFIAGTVILTIFAGINAQTINNILDSVTNTVEQLITFAISAVPFIIFMSILLFKPLREGFGSALAKIGGYPSKVIETFLK
ncbi:Uncharacterised protein [Candidatus Tiddalikarchaeum anstoanum]|nr:Uncharacterised protein [Candidatus Tiddalikarchaeum anstoanum]